MKNFASATHALIAVTLCSAALLTTACKDDSPMDRVDAGTMADAPTDAFVGWSTLLGRSWKLYAGQEAYRCVRIKTTSDLFLKGFRNVGSAGQYRLWLTVSTEESQITSNGNPDEWNCNPGSGAEELQGGGLYEAAIGTGTVTFPSGMGIHVKAGQYINMRIQLRNTTSGALDGSTRVEADFATASEVVQPLKMLYVGTSNVTIPNNVINYSLSGGCTLTEQWRVVGVMPRMDSMGFRMALGTVQNGESFATGTFNVADQPYYDLASQELVFNAGDQLRVECRFANFTGSVGSMPLQNCQMGLYAYPQPTTEFFMKACVN